MARQLHVSLKVLELLNTGFMIGYTRSGKRRRMMYEKADIERFSLDRKQLYDLLKKLRASGLVELYKDGNVREKIRITDKGRARLLERHFHSLSIKRPRRWDKRWRVVLYDIPESKRKTRNALRGKLKDLGFLEFQKSVFIFPYPCYDEINFVINFFDIEDYVYCIDANVRPDGALRAYFKLKKK